MSAAAPATAVESLERRTLLSASFANNKLTVTGDDGGAAVSDVINIRQGSTTVFGIPVPTVEVRVNGVIQFNNAVPPDSSIEVIGGFASDTLAVSFASGLPIPSGGLTFDGGIGADTLRLGASTFSGFSVVFFGGAEPVFNGFPLPDGDSLEATVTGGTDLTLTNSTLDNPNASGTTVTYSGASNVDLTGGTGDNVINASAFTGRLDVSGGAGNDTLTGGSGNDTLEGGEGNDLTAGGPGNDTYVFGTAVTDQTDSVQELINQGTDTLSFAGLGATDPVSVTLNNFTQIASHAHRTVRAVIQTVGDFTRIENVIGGAGDDTIGGEGRMPNRLVGGPGNDHLFGGSNGDTAGGFTDDDVLEGGDGNDILEGGDGEDVLNGQAGSDQVFGQAGTDTFIFEGTSAGEVLDVVSSGGATFQSRLDATRRATAGGTALETDTATLVEKLQIFALGGNDTVDLTRVSPFALLQQIIADGGTGADTLLGSPDDDDLRGGAGADSDRLEGNDGDDLLAGGDGFDTILGGEGNDTVTETGSNSIDLGNGEDGLLFFGTDGDDDISVSWQPGPQAVVTVNGVVNVTDYKNGETIFVLAGAGDDHVTIDENAAIRWKANFSGGDGDDRLTGNLNNDTLDGGEGDDRLDGGAGEDTLLGGPGKDHLDGGDGNDTLDGGPGKDHLNGGPGLDHFLAADGDSDHLSSDATDLLVSVDAVDKVTSRSGKNRG